MRYLLVPMLGLIMFRGAGVLAAEDVPHPILVASPDGRLRAEVLLERSAEGRSVPHYRVWLQRRAVVLPSRLGVALAEGPALGNDTVIERVTMRSIDETYTQFPGKRSRVVNRGNEAVIGLRERAEPPRRWEVVVRASDEGVAFRYRFPAQAGWSRLAVAAERTTIRLPAAARGYALPLKSFTTSHEALYDKRAVAQFPQEWLIDLPLLIALPERIWLAITEANLNDYAGLYLAHEQESEPTLACRLAPLPQEPNVAVRATIPHESPWRVFLIAEDLRKLVESDLILNLNAPCAIGDPSWIKPGKTTFPWWNGYYEKNVPFKPGLNTATMKYYIDFCAEAGIPYHSLDGINDTAWYGGHIVPYEGNGITKAVEGLDLAEVIRYAKAKGVQLRFWMHWRAAEKHMDRAFPIYRAWGIAGVMIDFMDRNDQEMVNFQRRLLQTAAENRLTVTFHGVAPPTGLERTYPNLLTSEAVMNLEYDKWEDRGVPPEHELTVPFTRMLAGPLDFHQGSLRGVTVEAFTPRNEAPLIMGTPCHMLASYVVFQNHLSMVADYPSAYRGHPALPVLASIPTTWDDTQCLAGSVGDYVVIARRSGNTWWVGAMTNRQPRVLEVPLSFLGPGRFRAKVYGDDLNAPSRLGERSLEVSAQDTIRGSLASAGGLLVRLMPRDQD
jgi:alpha-glucosidase